MLSAYAAAIICHRVKQALLRFNSAYLLPDGYWHQRYTDICAGNNILVITPAA